jgi:hypothetical protein
MLHILVDEEHIVVASTTTCRSRRAGRHRHAATPLEGEDARNPRLVPPPRRPEPPLPVMENPPVPHEEPAGRIGDDLACGKDAVL